MTGEPPNLPDAPAALRDILRRLPAETGGFMISQHYTDPQPDAWYAGLGGGDAGPFKSAEAALFGGIKWLLGLYEDARAEADSSA